MNNTAKIDRENGIALLKQIGRTIAEGHYHNALRDRFVEVLRIEGLEGIANAFSRIPDRSDYGVESGWATAALDLFINCKAAGKPL